MERHRQLHVYYVQYEKYEGYINLLHVDGHTQLYYVQFMTIIKVT